jgi:hypothetical protein
MRALILVASAALAVAACSGNDSAVDNNVADTNTVVTNDVNPCPKVQSLMKANDDCDPVIENAEAGNVKVEADNVTVIDKNTTTK